MSPVSIDQNHLISLAQDRHRTDRHIGYNTVPFIGDMVVSIEYKSSAIFEKLDKLQLARC